MNMKQQYRCSTRLILVITRSSYCAAVEQEILKKKAFTWIQICFKLRNKSRQTRSSPLYRDYLWRVWGFVCVGVRFCHSCRLYLEVFCVWGLQICSKQVGLLGLVVYALGISSNSYLFGWSGMLETSEDLSRNVFKSFFGKFFEEPRVWDVRLPGWFWLKFWLLTGFFVPTLKR